MKNFILQSAAFIIAFFAHAFYTISDLYNSYGQFEDLSLNTYFYSYLNSYKQFNGITFGLLAFFIVYVFRKYSQVKDFRAVGTGSFITGILLICGYLFLGINESTGMFNFFTNNMGYFYFKAQYSFYSIFVLFSVIIGIIIIWLHCKKAAID